MPAVAAHAHAHATTAIREAARTALSDPSQEQAQRLRILGELLHPRMAVVDRAIIAVAGRYPTVEHEIIFGHITSTLERMVTGDAPTFDLERALTGEPVGWADTLARQLVRSGKTEVGRYRARMGVEATLATGATAAPSAEDRYFELDDRLRVDQLVDDVDDLAGRRNVSKREKTARVAKAVLDAFDLPQLYVQNRQDQRYLSAVIDSDGGGTQILASLYAYRDLAAGEPHAEQEHVDNRLIALWMNYTEDDADEMLRRPSEIIMIVVRAAVAFPPRPQEQTRANLRRFVKRMSDRGGWPTLVMELERAWAAEFFDARPARDNMDRRSDEEAEQERAADAALWEEAARRAIQFPGNPLGRRANTPEAVAAWLDRAHRKIAA